MNSLSKLALFTLLSGAVFAAQAAAMVVYGTANAWAIAGGAWFGPVGWPRGMAALLRRLPQG